MQDAFEKTKDVLKSNEETSGISQKDDYDQNWNKVIALLEKEIGTTAVKNWLHPLVFISAKNHTLTLSAPTRFLANWIRSHYADAIRRLWGQNVAPIHTIDIEIDAAAAADSPANQDTPKVEKPAAVSENADYFGARLDPRMTFEGFVVGPANELAFAAAKRVAENDVAVFNPLFFYGGVGIGKTHLMHAIGWEIQNRAPEKNVVYLSAEKFMYHFVRALKQNDMVAFKDAFRNVDVLMIDDVQFISGKKSTQQEFIHTFNALLDQGKQIVISADKNPAELAALDERLKSRLGGGLSVDIQPADFDLRRRILAKKLDIAEKTIPDDVVDYLAEKISTNVRELEGALNRILAHADLMGRPVTLDGTQTILGDLFRAHDRKITIDDIQKAVAEFYNIKLSDMSSSRRQRAVARPRQIAMYLAKQMTPTSLPQIGQQFGGRDHTTVMHAVKKVGELIVEDACIAEDISRIEKSLKSI